MAENGVFFETWMQHATCMLKWDPTSQTPKEEQRRQYDSNILHPGAEIFFIGPFTATYSE